MGPQVGLKRLFREVVSSSIFTAFDLALHKFRNCIYGFEQSIFHRLNKSTRPTNTYLILRSSEDFREGVEALGAKRKPSFRGR